MERAEQVHALNDFLLCEMPSLRPQARAVPRDAASQRSYWRKMHSTKAS